MKLLKINSLIMMLLLLVSVQAKAIVMDFESLNQAGPGFNAVGTSYSESGFQLTSGNNGFLAPQTGNIGYWAGSTALFDDTINGLITLTKLGGGIFSLNSIDLSEVDSGRLGPTSVAFVGNQQGGGVLNASINLDGVFGFETLIFSGWDNLLSVTWQQTSQFHQFDNIALNNVPEPATLALLGLGLVGFGFSRRKH